MFTAGFATVTRAYARQNTTSIWSVFTSITSIHTYGLDHSSTSPWTAILMLGSSGTFIPILNLAFILTILKADFIPPSMLSMESPDTTHHKGYVYKM